MEKNASWRFFSSPYRSPSLITAQYYHEWAHTYLAILPSVAIWVASLLLQMVLQSTSLSTYLCTFLRVSLQTDAENSEILSVVSLQKL